MEYVQLQNQQLEMMMDQQLQEIEQLKQVKQEQDQIIQDLQKSSHYEKAIIESVYDKDEVGTPDDSRNSEVYQLEEELEQKDQYILQLQEQLQEAQSFFEKAKLLEEKNKLLKDKLAGNVDQGSSKFFWDLNIQCEKSQLSTLVREVVKDFIILGIRSLEVSYKKPRWIK